MKAFLIGGFLFISLNLADDALILGMCQIIAPITPTPVLVRTAIPGMYSGISNILTPAVIGAWIAINKRRNN